MIEDFSPKRISQIESMRLTLSIHYSKQDLKRRWKDLSPEFRKAIREEWGYFINDSYPFEVGDDEEFNFLDYYKQWY